MPRKAKVISISGPDKTWMAQDDARTLAAAAAIQSDPKRMKAAAEQAKKMADEQMEQAKAMKRIASRKVK